MKHRGIFVTFEGTEGAGKSTLIHSVARSLKDSHLGSRNILLTREPGGSPIAERIRNVVIEEAVDPLAELFLYEAARAEHVARKIRPALNQGDIVLCDRFTDSALAYQGFARGLPWKTVKLMNTVATGGLNPQLTVLLDIDPAVGLIRAREQTRFEAEGVEFQKKVRRGFLKARSENPSRWLVLKVAGKTPEELAQRVVKELLIRFKPKKAHG
ncbi:MAG TPA: dTMP kinase [Bdellovibrionales bacterium]|nr:MAG: dTMP kinase [Bdellovibrionales bacterium GWB1_52_6]OFZ04664.1 MAG: dTMP kinase [Bdellovibrionales bacterium GWA1_52_35]HAR42334.1 dTMP kinase [Bdellovibrionales bacterium]HCM39920.1 dTMP kinase [Bdellovibrionales bacterium]